MARVGPTDVVFYNEGGGSCTRGAAPLLSWLMRPASTTRASTAPAQRRARSKRNGRHSLHSARSPPRPPADDLEPVSDPIADKWGPGDQVSLNVSHGFPSFTSLLCRSIPHVAEPIPIQSGEFKEREREKAMNHSDVSGPATFLGPMLCLIQEQGAANSKGSARSSARRGRGFGGRGQPSIARETHAADPGSTIHAVRLSGVPAPGCVRARPQ